MEAEQASITLPGITTLGSITLFRYCSYDAPFWVRRNSRPGRWHRLGDEPTQYWSMTPEAAWAELIRAEVLQSETELDLVRLPLWVCRVPVVGMVDLREADNVVQCGMAVGDLTDSDWTTCQEAGSNIRQSRAPGVIAPCAALDGHANVTLFGARRMIDWKERPALARAVPATIAALGRPLERLLEHVRHTESPPLESRLF